jgi:hypothetical protein
MSLSSCAWGRAPALEEARNRRDRIAKTAALVAVERIAAVFEAGRGTLFQRARHRGLCYRIAVSREHRRAKTDRLGRRAALERDQCSEGAERPNR